MKTNWKKGEISADKIIGWGIGLLVLVLIVVLYFILKGKGISMIDYIKNILRFGR